MNFSALKFPQFRRYLAANIIALHGLWVQRITTGWLAWELTGSASFVGVIAFFTYIPTMLTGPFFGVLVDRINVRYAAMTTQALQFSISFLAFVLQFSGVMTPGVLSIIAILIGLVNSAQNPIRMSFMPRLVPKDHVGSVIVLSALNFNLARVVGPAIGGVLIARADVETALLVAALAYLPAVATIATLKPRPRIRPNTKSTILADFAEGMRFIFASRFILNAILITGVFSLTARGAMEILPIIADGKFDKGATGLGVLSAAAGIGALIAAIMQSLSRQPKDGKLLRPALFSVIAGPLLVIFLGSAGHWYLVVFIVGMLGFFGTIVGISMQTSIQLQLDDTIRGRVMSLWIMIALGATAMGSVAIGALIDLFGLTLTLQGVGGASSLLIILLIPKR